MKPFILALTFFTRVPYPLKFEFDDGDFAKGLLWMPLIGGIIGLPMALFVRFMPGTAPPVTAFLLILIYLAMTGGLHLDGLGDYCDGVFSGRERARILEIMKDAHMGVFGVIGLCLYFLGMYTGLQGASWPVVFLTPVVGRMTGLMFCALGSYPREGGMGQAMVAYGRWYHGVLWLVPFMALLGYGGEGYLMAGGVTGFFMALFFLRTHQVIGGVTGDVVGAAIEISQVVWLLSFAITGRA